MRNERYCSDIQLQILKCIKESPKASHVIKQQLGISESISTHTRKLKHLGLISKIGTDNKHCPIWMARETYIARGADDGE